VLDGSGAVNNDFLGDTKSETLRPTGAGTATGWTPSTGSNWQNVDDTAPNDDADYNSTSTAGATDTFALGDLATTPAAIYGVQACVEIRKDDAGSRSAALVLRSGGTAYVGATQSVLDAYTVLREIWEADPATGLPWTAAAVNNLEVGYRLIS